MKKYVHLWQYLTEFFLEWEMFRNKVVEKIKTHILCSVTFSQKSYSLWPYFSSMNFLLWAWLLKNFPAI